MLLDVAPTTGTEPSPSLVRRVLSFPAMLGTALVLLAVFTVRERFHDPDLWWHLKTGEIIWNTHSIPTTDIFSFTTNHHSWVPHEWLSEVLIYAAYRMGDYTGLMLWLCVFSSAYLLAQYALCSSYSGNAKVAFLGSAVAWLFATIAFSIRPQMIGYLFLTFELLIVHLGRTRNARWFWTLPPLFALWVNCHGSWVFGLMVLGVFLLTSCLELRWGLIVSQRWEKSRRNVLVGAYLLSTAALSLNPTGFHQLLYPFDVFLHQKVSLAQIAEWQPLAVSDSRASALGGVAGGILLWVIIRRSELFLHELLLISMGFVMAWRHGRMMFVFGLLAAPIVSRLLAGAWEGYDRRRDSPGVNAISIALLSICIVLGFPNRTNLREQVRKTNPVQAIEFMRQNGFTGRMLNEYAFGGFIIWSAPDIPVFIDGRGDVFDWTGVFADYRDLITLKDDPRSILDKYRIDFCLFSKEYSAARVLKLLPGWKLVYSDDVSVIYART